SMPPQEFEKQMQYLSDCGYKSLTLRQYAQLRQDPEHTFDNNIVVTFDDGYDDNRWAAMPIMQKYGYTGTIFVAIKFMAWPGYVTWQDLWALQDGGWEIASHTYNHIALGKCGAEELNEELATSRSFLNNMDKRFDVKTLAYPFGSYNDKVYQALRDNGYIAAVTGVDGVNTDKTPLLKLYRVNIFHDSNGMNGFKQRIARAQLSSWLRSYGIDFVKI
ncbi:MAG: polysaccharide deacetylase family protein, partial [Acidaminococcaceae bacterium]